LMRTAALPAAAGPNAWPSAPLASSSCVTVRIAASLARGWHARAYPFSRTPRVDEVEGPLLRLLVQPAEVLADQPECHQLHAAQEQDHRHHRGPAGHRVAPEQSLEDDPEPVAEGDQGGRDADIGR